MAHYGSNEDIENRIQLALASIQSGECANLNVARVKYHVPKDRLYRRAKGVPPNLGHGGTNKRLNPIQEAALINYIKRCDDIGFSAMPHMILSAAEVILNAEITPPLILAFLGRDWVSRFLKAHLEL
jgi:hypothetical protein